MVTPRRRLLVPLAATVLVCAGLWGSGASAATTVTTLLGPVPIAPGTDFTRYEVVHPDGSKAKVHVLEINPATAATVDVGYATEHLPGTGNMSSWAPTQGAAAAINGDFSTDDRPDHLFVQDGAVWQTGPRKGAAFGVRQDETGAYARAPRFGFQFINGTQRTKISRWNSGEPNKDQLAGYSPEAGNVEDPPGNACSARLGVVDGTFRWSTGRKALLQDYIVLARKCGVDPLPERGKVVVTSRRGPASLQAAIKSLVKGQTVTIRSSYSMPGTVDAIGGLPLLLDNGSIPTFTPCSGNSTLYCKHNRSAVGYNQACAERTAGCRIFFVVVDSRLNGWSSGMTPLQLANFMKDRLDAWDALNLDGGGSAAMWVRANAAYPAGTCQFKSTATGCFVNRPVHQNQTMAERAVENALLVKDGSDLFPTAEPIPAGP
jgi:hypothetical protein